MVAEPRNKMNIDSQGKQGLAILHKPTVVPAYSRESTYRGSLGQCLFDG